ncbi:zinc finger HIT domain-containing protein 1 [Agrilus planipennis]|uniref:Zinc finger HIT domain-containing protein 1 n=1 Tax=Agrilus planipennis TaxID=224129 RepID=A0A1W4WRF9_AGRPL|nr:zinc finger HIT domain-containing protein 1 [Agrilus planipennis]
MTISKLTLRGSARLKEVDKCKIVDETSRRRRHRKNMEILEADNYHEDPHADLVMSKKIPKFDENLETRTRSRKKEKNPEYYQAKFRKHILQLLEEDRMEAEITGRYSYQDLVAEDTDHPARHFCAVCGFFSQYVCLACGMRYCSIKCMDTHMDTRCLKWTA